MEGVFVKVFLLVENKKDLLYHKVKIVYRQRYIIYTHFVFYEPDIKSSKIDIKVYSVFHIKFS